ncbi:MAG: twin-arginine translocase TatA/TatE family subunit [Acidobacteriota bacterium]
MTLPALLLPLSPMELGVIVVIVLLLFGASRLGEIGKGAGEAIRNFKKSMKDEEPAAIEGGAEGESERS